mgnify:CR=1 FL=1
MNPNNPNPLPTRSQAYGTSEDLSSALTMVNLATPVVGTPVVGTPVVNTPVVDTPTVDTPTVDTPAVNTPVVATPTVATPSNFSAVVNIKKVCRNPIRVRIVNDMFNVVFPCTKKRRRAYITFSKSWPFGTDPKFGKYISKMLRQVARKWKNEEQMYRWFNHNRLSWKSRVTSQWRRKSKRKYNRAREERQQFNEALATLGTMGGQRQVEMVAPVVSKGKDRGAYVIPLPDFEDLKSSKSRTGEVHLTLTLTLNPNPKP